MGGNSKFCADNFIMSQGCYFKLVTYSEKVDSYMNPENRTMNFGVFL